VDYFLSLLFNWHDNSCILAQSERFWNTSGRGIINTGLIKLAVLILSKNIETNEGVVKFLKHPIISNSLLARIRDEQ
jgi:hypothetical protein